MLLGLAGMLAAPSRGLLFYSPALVLVPWGVMALFSRSAGGRSPFAGAAICLAWLTAAGATLVLYARWGSWWGGWCYGPRFLIETTPVLCLCFALAYERLESRRWRRAAAWLVALSVAVHLLGVFGHHREWNERHDCADQGRCLFSLRDTQIEAHARFVVRRIASLGRGPRTD